jgi:hypothetical protein
MSRNRQRPTLTAEPRTVRYECAAAAGAVGARIFSSLDEIADGLREVFDSADADGRQAGTRDVQELRPLLLQHLARHGRLFDGTGVVTEPGMLTDQDRYLEWWRAPGPRRLSLDLDPNSETFYDYTQMEWFAVPHDTGQRVAHGPWVDYRGADRYVVTFARPVLDSRGRFVGVAGADVPLTGLEEAVMPALRSVPADLALVNGRGRVVASSSAAVAPGTLLRSVAEDRVTPVAELGSGWRVVDL